MIKSLISLSLASVALAQWHVGSNSAYSSGGTVSVDVPSGAENDDLLVLFLMRTDDFLPLSYRGWNYAASCYKSDNGQSECHEVADCITSSSSSGDGTYCSTFRNSAGDGGSGKDLATLVLTRRKGSLSRATFNIKNKSGNGHPSWAILTVLRGAEESVRTSAGVSCDRRAQSRFRSVSGKAGDILLLSMVFDDTTRYSKFTAPPGTEKLDFVYGNDEAGAVYGYQFATDKSSGVLTTGGDGASHCKDGLISLVIRGTGTVTSSPTPSGTGNTGDGTKVSSALKTCNAYCASQSATCEGAWEDYANSCVDFLAKEECSTDFTEKYGGTSDMCCKCSGDGGPPDPCDGRVLTKTAAKHKTCNNFCDAQDQECVGAWEDNKNSCDSIKATETCSTNFYSKYSGTSDMICKCTPKGSLVLKPPCEDDSNYMHESGDDCAFFEGKDCTSGALSPGDQIEIQKNCPKACGLCSQTTADRAVPLPSCSTATWPDKVLECGTCKVAVTNFQANHGGLCSTYCASVGLACLAAWPYEQEDNATDVCASASENSTQLLCDRLSLYDTDAICECGTPVKMITYELPESAGYGSPSVCLLAMALPLLALLSAI